MTSRTHELADLYAEIHAHRSPCLGSPLWVSDNSADQNRAAELCRTTCPIEARQACEQLAQAIQPTGGIWNGINRTPSATARRKRTARAA